ncbi:hypothetical protein [Haloarchaeobius sp. TZWWS8]|uniref:hypothetical protein n=1 Tax=Haloarchaeobius sp. TZWWS8 TaxID=3446121 RepID=UPI003EB8B400
MNRRDAAIAALLVGLAVAAHPLYLDVKPGETKVYLDVDPASAAVGEVDDERVVNFTDLPRRAQTAVEAAAETGDASLWLGTDSAAVDALASHDYVRWDGQLYRSRVEAREGLFSRVDTVVSPLVSLVGVIAALLGGRTLVDVAAKGGT